MPLPKPWRDRSNTVGYITGGTEAQLAVLRQVLAQLPCNSKSVLTWQKPDGKEASAVCEQLCNHQLSSGGLAERAPSGDWVPSKSALEWLRNDDPVFLAMHLHANVKFFGELLEAIGANTTHADLLEVAKSSYGMNWTTLDQVRRRTGWLRCLGMVELWGHKIVRTAAGDSLLNILKLCPPEEAMGVQESEAAAEIDDTAVLEYVSSVSDIDKDALRARRPLIGYIPRGINSANRDVEDAALTPIASVRKIIDIVGPGVAVDEFRQLCGEELGISKSSFYSTLHGLRHMGVIEQTAYNFFAPTNNAQWLTAVGNEKAFVAYLHGRYMFFGEILENLTTPSSPSQLVKLAKERYGFSQASNSEVRLRLGFLQDAGLADRVDWQRFRVTGAGKTFVSLLKLQVGLTAEGQEVNDEAVAEERHADQLVSSIVDDLKKYGNDGNESKAFELVVSRAFRFLGFHTEHLGGPGQTDVLGLAELAPGDRYRIIVDAKSSSSGSIAESGVNFQVLRDHRKKHKADHVVVVGSDFANRLKDWAVDNGVVLLQTSDLGDMLEHHSISPISLVDLRDTFTRVDIHKDEMLERYQLLERRSAIMSKILELAFQEATDEDPIAAGFISLENITYALRKEFNPRPSADEIREALEFLSNPLVAALEEGKGRYKLADAPHNVSLRLHGFGEVLKPNMIRRD
jgi:hypothetical protein